MLWRVYIIMYMVCHCLARHSCTPSLKPGGRLHVEVRTRAAMHSVTLAIVYVLTAKLAEKLVLEDAQNLVYLFYNYQLVINHWDLHTMGLSKLNRPASSGLPPCHPCQQQDSQTR